MALNKSATDIRLEGDQYLCARLKISDKDYVDAKLDLNELIANTNGFLNWDLASDGFIDTVKDICLIIDDDGHVTLSADARKRDGSYRRQSINLDEKLENIDGELIYTGS